MTQYAVIYKESRTEHDYYDPEHPSTVQVDKLEQFDSQVKLLSWIERNDESYSRIKNYKVYELKELTVNVERKLNIKLT